MPTTKQEFECPQDVFNNGMKLQLADAAKDCGFISINDCDLRIAHKASLLGSFNTRPSALANNFLSQLRQDHSPDHGGQKILRINEGSGCGEAMHRKAMDKIAVLYNVESAPRKVFSRTGVLERSIAHLT